MNTSFCNFYRGQKVLVTGHTGFKGSWLSLWLKELGATVIGYSLEPPTEPNLFDCCKMNTKVNHITGDVRNFPLLKEVVEDYQPDIIFHLAAQPLVLYSYTHPQETFEVNAQGTINVMEAAVCTPSVKGLVMITTDKVYENHEWLWGYRESDGLGGHDPYSASKAMAEIAINSYRKSFSMKGIASARSGNVIGGGDFAENRLIPDTMQALMNRQPIGVRNPDSVRPWMHVLEPLSGYLELGRQLVNNPNQYGEAWNFAPKENRPITCKEMVEQAIKLWGEGDWLNESDPHSPHEMNVLRLNGDKASTLLHWNACLEWNQSLQLTIEWYQEYSKNKDLYALCANQIQTYTLTAKQQRLPWAFASKEERVHEIH